MWLSLDEISLANYTHVVPQDLVALKLVRVG